MPSLSSEQLETASSPYLNRFVQPDTIIPAPSNPQSWNRYSYTINNPVKYNDPTGHKFECDDISKDGKCITLRLPKASARLTTGDEISWGNYSSSGEKMKEVHEWYKTHPGQWNNYGKDDFTVEDFLAWTIDMEIGYTLQSKKYGPGAYVEAAKKLAAEKMMGYCNNYSSTGYCTYINDNAIYNYIASRASMGNRYWLLSDYGGNGKVDYVEEKQSANGPWFDATNYSLAKEVAKRAASYTGAGSYADWGNGSMFTASTRGALSGAGAGDSYNNYLLNYPGSDGESALYFLNNAQNLYWYGCNAGGC